MKGDTRWRFERIATIIKFVMTLAAEAELAALFITARKMVPHWQTLINMRWPQPCSPVQTDNSTAIRVTNKTIVAKRAKMMDMRLWRLQCRGSQKQFPYYWDAGSKNWADYSTKHHHESTTKPTMLHKKAYGMSNRFSHLCSYLNRVPFLFFIFYHELDLNDHCKGV